MVTIDLFVGLAVILFVIGVAGLALRRNALVAFMCIELMLNATNLLFATYSNRWSNLDGFMMVFFVMVIAAAEAVVGLALILSMFRVSESTDFVSLTSLKDE
jgi:NADH-quinone oxidoreductase subunit K